MTTPKRSKKKAPEIKEFKKAPKKIKLSDAMERGYKAYHKLLPPIIGALFSAERTKKGKVRCGACALGYALLGVYNGPLAKLMLKQAEVMAPDNMWDANALKLPKNRRNVLEKLWGNVRLNGDGDYDKSAVSQVIDWFDSDGLAVPQIIRKLRKGGQ